MDGGAWWAAAHGVAKSRTWLSDFTFTFHFRALEKEMATHSSVLAWRIPGMGEPGGLPSMGPHRVGHDWSDLAAAAAAGIKLPYDPAIPLVGIYPKETITEKNKSIPTFSAALFTIARTWKQPRCSWTNEWIKSCGIYTQWNVTQL